MYLKLLPALALVFGRSLTDLASADSVITGKNQSVGLRIVGAYITDFSYENYVEKNEMKERVGEPMPRLKSLMRLALRSLMKLHDTTKIRKCRQVNP